jgi:hypothetical protein
LNFGLCSIFLEIKPYSKEHLERFGSEEALDKVVHYAWYLFCYKILQGVNHHWVTAMEDKNLLKKLPVFNYVLLSDLVLAVWIVYTHLELVTMKLNKKSQANDGEIKYAGIDEEKKKGGRERGLKTGKHISKHELPWYNKLYEEFKEPFENNKTVCIKWNKIFWKQMKMHNERFKKVNCPQEKRKRKRHFVDIDVPDCDPPAMQIENDENDSDDGCSDNGSIEGGGEND